MNSRQVCVVRLDAISIDPQLQPRCEGVDPDHVAALMEAPEAWPPIIVFRREASLVLGDGFHRIEAATRLGFTELPAVIVDGLAEVDLAQQAFDLNLQHGRALTLADKRARAAELIREHPDWSDREIGRRTALNHETVGALRYPATTQRRYERKPGEIDSDVGVFDPIRRARGASRPQKAITGYLKRLSAALEDPWDDDNTGNGVEGWCDDPTLIAEACFATLGPDHANDLLGTIEQDARFLASVGRARKSISKNQEKST